VGTEGIMSVYLSTVVDSHNVFESWERFGCFG